MNKKRVFWSTLFIFLLTGPFLMAQPGKYGTGPDSTECLNRLSFYREYVRAGDLLSAVPSWRIAIRLCPTGVNQNLYNDGAKILKALMQEPGVTPEHREGLVDSLLLMYDIRINNYPPFAPTALQNKIFDLKFFRPNAKEEHLAELERLLNLMGDATPPPMLTVYMDIIRNKYAEEKCTAEEVMDTYSRLMAILEAQEKKQPENEEIKVNKKIVEDMFIASGVATCDNLITLFTPRFAANPNDLELVSKIVSLLAGSGCESSNLFLQTVTTLNRLSPSYKTAYYLFKLYAVRGEHSEALKYLREAINSPEVSPAEKGQYLIDEGLLHFRNFNNHNRAMTAARAAMDASPAMRGKAYMLIATIWASQRCGDTDIEKRAPFWVAVDYLVRAKAADSSCAEEADRMIANYRQYFPLQEEAFMHDLMEGSEYKVTCGSMSETTTVRTRK